MKKLLLLAGVMLAIVACNKDKDETEAKEETFSPVPLKVSYPAWVETYLGPMPDVPGNPLTVEGVALGRKLFYDTKLSDNYTLSCASCHRQEHAFTDTAVFSAGTNGALGNRNAMQIINLGWSNKLFWDGRRTSLEGQAHDPVTNMIEMRNSWKVVAERLQADAQYPGLFFKAFGTRVIDSNLVTKAIAQFERTLVSFSSRFDRYYFENDTTVFNESEKRGMQVFMKKGDCNHCHTDVLLTDDALRNNGLDNVFTDKGLGMITHNPQDDGKFKVPTLRNIEVTGPYMHDSRFATLEQVVDHYSTGIKASSPNIDENMELIKNGINLTTQEKADLVAFLKTFTDHSFLTDPAFSMP